MVNTYGLADDKLGQVDQFARWQHGKDTLVCYQWRSWSLDTGQVRGHWQHQVQGGGHCSTGHVYAGQVLYKVEVELAKFGEHGNLAIVFFIVIFAMFANTDPGIDHT